MDRIRQGTRLEPALRSTEKVSEMFAQDRIFNADIVLLGIVWREPSEVRDLHPILCYRSHESHA